MSLKTVSVEASQINGFRIETHARHHIVHVDQPAEMGGSDAGPTPLEFLLISLASCLLTVGKIVAQQRNLPVRNLSARVEGDIDPDGFLGRNPTVRVGASQIRVYLRIEGDLTPEGKEAFIREIEARCPISDNIGHATPIELVLAQEASIA
ncbi:MAG: OsmC family protein [Thermanaerothrix sp.]|uniref:OsmC family protein n=1 Tax=Thermanaerothrix solaris TaxID=3058434 RepID=A0ABU3NPL5_9CHLR|nr:OsmC family protein [Thermanaerothrix sp. 4228-RoL]MDT8898777.1 OsmC family protein [Thermanaerothrix sp. 4228-RoL]